MAGVEHVAARRKAGQNQRRARRSTSPVVLGAVSVLALAVVAVVPIRPSGAASVDVVESCTAQGALTETGSKLISAPMATQITGSPLAITVPTTVDATAAVNPGGTVTVTATLHLDLSAVADDILQHRVKPGVVAAGYPQLAPTAWTVLDLDGTHATFPVPAGTSVAGSPTATAGPVGAAPSVGAGGVTVTLAHLHVDTRAPQPPIDVTVSWQLLDGGAPAPRTLDHLVPTVGFTAETTVGLLFFGAPITGGVIATWACAPPDPGEVLATTTVTDAPVTTTTAPSTTAPASTTTAPQASSTTSTTWPSTTTTPEGSCAVAGFDAYDGYTGVQRTATGWFRTEQIDGRWWLVDPDGHPFWSSGINHITMAGTPDRFGATPYRDAAVARYGTEDAWGAAQRDRMQQWGYNTAGGWSDVDQFTGRMPYTVLLDLTGMDFASGQLQDLFDPAWEASVKAKAIGAAATYGGDAYLLGYWTDNELHFGPDWRPLHLFDADLDRPASAPEKQALLTWLQARYPSFAAFAADVQTTATSWATLAGPTTVTSFTPTGGAATRTAWVGVVAERYFSVTHDAIRAADPHHLDLGPRLIAHTAGVPLLEAAARHVDVVSFNLYPILPELLAPLLNADPTYLPVDGPLAAQSAILHKPVLISEWSYRAADSGLPNTWPPLFPTLATQDQRAAAYEAYVTGLLRTDFVVGQHFFEHSDEPPAGRSDGEDSNFGLVDLHDDPYPQMTAISRTMHDCAYARLLAAPSPTTTTTTTPDTTGTTGTTGTTAPGSSATPGSSAAPAVAAVPSYTG